jgi:hypothetical protein
MSSQKPARHIPIRPSQLLSGPVTPSLAETSVAWIGNAIRLELPDAREAEIKGRAESLHAIALAWDVSIEHCHGGQM